MREGKPLTESEFDRFAEAYHAQHAANIAVSGESPDFFAEYKIIDVAQALAARNPAASQPGDVLNVLDFGAGIGNSVPFFHKHLPNGHFTCLDVSRKSLDLGRARFGELARFIHFDGGALPFPDRSFDIILCACVLHHIDHAQHAALLTSLRQLLTERGLLFIFEHNPMNPLTLRAVNTCPFDANAKLITAWSLAATLASAGYSEVKTRYRIFFPGPLRKLRWLEKYLGWCPIGAQYSLIAGR